MLATHLDPIYFSSETVLERAIQLYANQFYSSSLELHLARRWGTREQPLWIARTHKLLGDVLAQRHEYKAAASQYETALSIAESHPDDASHLPPTKPIPGEGTTTTTNVGASTSAASTLIYSLHTQLCVVYDRLGRPKQVLSHLSKLPETQRSLGLLHLLAKASEQLRNTAVAIRARTAIVKHNPYALREYCALARLGSPWSEVRLLLEALAVPEWVTMWVQVMYSALDHSRSALSIPVALQQSRQLESSLFAGNPGLLVRTAELSVANNEPMPAFYILSQLHQSHPLWVCGMDLYAQLMKLEGNSILISKLSEAVKNAVQGDCPELWVIMAHFCEAQCQYDRSLTFVEKALSLRPNYHHALLVKGTILRGLDRSEAAVTVYRQAHLIEATLATYQGLIDTYLSLSRLEAAQPLAKSVLEQAPNHPLAMTLMGVVWAQEAETQERAQEMLTGALKNDPKCTEAIMGLVSLFVEQQEWTKAVELFEKYIPHNNTEYMHTRFGDVLVLDRDLTRAHFEYTTALSMNPQYTKAVEGLARVDELMKEEHEDGYNSAEPEYEDGEAEEEEEEDEMNSQFELEERDLDADIERATDEIEYEYAESSQHVGTEEDDDADQTAHLSPQAPITSMDSFMSDEATPVVRLGASSLSFHMISPPAPGGRPLRGPPQHQRYITPSEAELSRIQPLGLPTGLTNDFSMLTATPVDSSGESGRGMGPLTISATSSGASSQFVTPTVTGPPRDPFDQSDNAMAPMYGRIGHNGSLGLPAVPGGGRPFAVPALPTRLNFRVGNQFVTPNNASASSSAAGSNNDDTDDHGAMSLLNDSCTLASDRTLAGGSHRVFSAHDETPSTAITPLTRISAGAPPIARPQFMPPPAFTASSSSSTLLSGPPPTLSLTASTPVAFSLVPNVTTGQDSPEVSTDVDSATVTPLPGASFARPGVAAPFKGFSLAALAESELDEYDGEDMVED